MRRYFMMAVVGMMFGLLPSEASGQTLTLSGTCPGLMTFSVTGATPNSRVAFLHAQNTGSFVIPFGLVCGGTTTGLAAPVVLAGFGTTNGAGNLTVNVNIPLGWCGNRHVQVVDTFPCSTTNVVLVI